MQIEIRTEQVDESNLRRTLLGVPPWLIERYSVNDNQINLTGWALPPDGIPDNWVFLVNGRAPDVAKYNLTTPSLEQVFPFCSGSEKAAFSLNFAITKNDTLQGSVEIQLVNKYSRIAASDYFNQYIDLQFTSILKIPHPDQLYRTQGNRLPERYTLHGYTTFKRLELALFRHSGKTIEDFCSILDWGCGCGRLTQQLALRLPRAQVRGVDIDEPNVRWCQENITNAHFEVVPLLPPTQLEGNAYDLIIGISVMTHLDLDTQRTWLNELRRVSKSGGYVVLTTHGESALARVKNLDVIQSTLAFGTDATTGDRSLDNTIMTTEYYKSTYHLRHFARKFFSDYFEVIDIIPAGNASLQDIIVMRNSVEKSSP